MEAVEGHVRLRPKERKTIMNSEGNQETIYCLEKEAVEGLGRLHTEEKKTILTSGRKLKGRPHRFSLN